MEEYPHRPHKEGAKKATQEKGTGSRGPRPGHFCPQCGQFLGF